MTRTLPDECARRMFEHHNRHGIPQREIRAMHSAQDAGATADEAIAIVLGLVSEELHAEKKRQRECDALRDRAEAINEERRGDFEP